MNDICYPTYLTFDHLIFTFWYTLRLVIRDHFGFVLYNDMDWHVQEIFFDFNTSISVQFIWRAGKLTISKIIYVRLSCFSLRDLIFKSHMMQY